MCYGVGCHVTFSNCHFDLDTKIVALAGASVQLTGCTFTRNGFNAVFAHACGTCVTVESCFFTGGEHPVSVAGGGDRDSYRINVQSATGFRHGRQRQGISVER